MSKNDKSRLPEDSEATKPEPVAATEKTEQGSANPSFPEEYEEQRSMKLRMKPQPLVKAKKKVKLPGSKKQ